MTERADSAYREIHDQLLAVERQLLELKGEVVGEDRLTALRFDALKAELTAVRQQIETLEASKLNVERYEPMERVWKAAAMAAVLAIVANVMRLVLT